MTTKPRPSSALAARMAATTRGKAPGELPKFEHRLTLDLDTPRYAVLREAAFRLRVPATSLLRALITVLMESPSSPVIKRAAELATDEARALRSRKPGVR